MKKNVFNQINLTLGEPRRSKKSMEKFGKKQNQLQKSQVLIPRFKKINIKRRLFLSRAKNQ